MRRLLCVFIIMLFENGPQIIFVLTDQLAMGNFVSIYVAIKMVSSYSIFILYLGKAVNFGNEMKQIETVRYQQFGKRIKPKE